MFGIIVAMSSEIKYIKNLMMNVQEENFLHIKIFSGKLDGVNCVLALSGPGKVNSAICTQLIISRYSPRFILNVGVAGALKSSLKIGSAVFADYVVQHDIDTTAVGDEPGLISGLNMVKIPCSKNLNEKILDISKRLNQQIHIGTIATGDQFVSSDEKLSYIRNTFNAIACEMEAGSIGQTCLINNVDFAILKIISDNANNNSSIDYNKFKFEALQKIANIIKKLI